MLEELIESFLEQDYSERELCISDDSRTDSVRMIVDGYDSPEIRYFHNPINLGYGHNLRASLAMATGEVIVILGDDDFFARSDTLSRYAEAFGQHPGAHFAYSNLVQVDESRRATLLYPFFKKDSLFDKGVPALNHLLLKSILITGIGLRNTSEVDAYYPDATMLFPQVELVARLLSAHDGIGLSGYLCATRAHSEQLGFKAIRGQLVKGGEQHSNVEVTKMIHELGRYIPAMVDVEDRLSRQLAHKYMTNLVNEKILAGNRAVVQNTWDLVRTGGLSVSSALMVVTCVVALILPASLASRVKITIRSLVATYQFRRDGVDPRGLVND